MNIKDIEVGMYIRTHVGIAKVLKVDLKYDKVICGTKEGWGSSFNKDNEFKASHNITKVIEVGDYVNGYKVTAIGIISDYVWLGNDTIAGENEIKSIVTKEHFERGKFVL